jgi:hypothetical protein
MSNLTRSEQFLAQQQKVFDILFKRPQTMLQVAKKARIMRENICRYVASFRKAGTICITKIEVDPLTGHKAQYLSTNPETCKWCQAKIQFDGTTDTK